MVKKIERVTVSFKPEDYYTPENIVQGNPRACVGNQYTDPTQRFNCGVWTCSKGRHEFEQTDSEEFCVLIKGKVCLRTADGSQAETFKAGDAFVIPLGFKGSWETIEDVTKFYATMESSASAGAAQSKL